MATKNIRIRDWATQHGLQNKNVIAALDAFGFPGKTASSNLPPEAMDRLVAKFNLKPAGKPASESKSEQPQKTTAKKFCSSRARKASSTRLSKRTPKVIASREPRLRNLPISSGTN